MKSFYLLAISLVGLSIGCERAKEAQMPLSVPGTAETQTAQQPQLQTSPASPSPEAASINVGNVVLTPAQGMPITYSVEIAKTADEKRQGLMGRENLPDKHGMWFVFDEDVQDPFWMKDTLIPLDMIFVDSSNKIVDIIANTPVDDPKIPDNKKPLFTPSHPYRYVLEVKAGTAANLKLVVGDKAEFRLGPP